MNSIGIAGAISVIASAASIASVATWLSSQSPSARLPIWSWFCRKLTKAVGAKLAARLAAQVVRRKGGGFALIDEAGSERAQISRSGDVV